MLFFLVRMGVWFDVYIFYVVIIMFIIIWRNFCLLLYKYKKDFMILLDLKLMMIIIGN